MKNPFKFKDEYDLEPLWLALIWFYCAPLIVIPVAAVIYLWITQ